MYPQFGATSDSLGKASSLMFRIGTDAHLYDDPEDVNIAPLLDSRYDSEKCEALKRLLALIAQGADVSNFFPQVVKNVASTSLEVKKLVYVYLLHYAQKRPNEALLSINYFQKDLSDPNPLVRAWALRAMAGIRLHVIAPLVLVAVSKCARDPSAFVRKCAANALSKLYNLHLEENASALEEVVCILLSDHSPGVVGAAAAAFNCVCPNNLVLIGRNFRRLCETLPDVEEWGQIVLIGILLRYVVAVHGLVKESIMFSSQTSDSEKNGAHDHLESNTASVNDVGRDDTSYFCTWMSRCYIEGPDDYLSRLSHIRDSLESDSVSSMSSKINEDVKLLLQCTSPLFWSHNSSVVLAAAGVHWIMAPREDLTRVVKPLLFLLRSFPASEYVVLCNIQVFSKTMPSLFAPHYEDFFVCSSDSYQIKALKLDILSMIATDSSVPHIFQEFQDYIRDPDRKFVADTLAAIGLCAKRIPSLSRVCLEGLLALTKQVSSLDGDEDVLAQAIMSIKAVIKKDPITHEKVIIQLIRSLDSIKVPSARAMIVWMVGEYNSVGQIIPRMLTTVLKYLAGCFTFEALETKHQILSTTVKVVLYATGDDSSTFRSLLSYIVQLSRSDLNYDIRDRARLFEKLLSCHISSPGMEGGSQCGTEKMKLQHKLAENIFGIREELEVPPPNNFRIFLPGSLSQIVLHAAPGYEPLPRPGSLCNIDLVQQVDNLRGLKTSWRKSMNSDSSETSNEDTLSGSLDEETDSLYSSRHSVTSSGVSDGTSDIDEEANPLIRLSDVGFDSSKINGSTEMNSSMQSSDSLEGLMSNRALESWLDARPGMSEVSSSRDTVTQTSSGRVSLKDIEAKVNRKVHSLLDPKQGNGLKIDYSFSSEVSGIFQSLVCVELSFENCSTESLTTVAIIDEDSCQRPDATNIAAESSISHVEPKVVPMEEIASLEPGQTTKRTLHVQFQHHLLPLKLAICCDGRKLPVKLRPDIGYFVKPLPMDAETFKFKESQLPGMFEYGRSCTFADHMMEINSEDGNTLMKDNLLVVCQSLVSKMLSNANLFLVSVDMPVSTNFDDASGLCFRFSGEILSNSIPCLVTITAEGKCSMTLNLSAKVNCEETIFGLNLLNRIVAILS